MANTIRFSLVLLLCAMFRPAYAAFSPIAVSVLPAVQFPPSDFDITGVRLSVLAGKQRSVYGLDFAGVGNITDLDFVGLGVSGIFNWTNGTTNVLGLQLAGLANVNTSHTTVYGLQAAFAVNNNSAEAKVVGLQLAAFNVSPFTKICGFQVGLYNRANDVYGFQIGVINVAKSLHGVQIGLLNFNETGLFYVAPVLNIGF